MTYRFHILGIPHTATNKRWLCCAYTQKVLKLCAMLHDRGHHVIHYGNEASEVVCDEHVTVTAGDELGPSDGYLRFDLSGPLYAKFTRNAAREVGKRKQPRDFLLCMWGAGHKSVAEAHPDMIVIEPGIGYAGGHFAKFKVFESYAMLHAYYGLSAVGTSGLLNWYDVVIPNYFEVADFQFSAHKDDYLLFLGRVGAGKGIYVAIEIAQRLGKRLIVAGPPHDEIAGTDAEYVGIVGEVERRKLLAHAKALLAPSNFIEPFCGTVTEAHLSGTPAITADWGAMAENNLHGLTGYRCRTFEQFLWAVNHIDRISPMTCRSWAQSNFSIERVGDMYEEYFASVMTLWTGKGWYEPNAGRRDLDWLAKYYPFLPAPARQVQASARTG